MFIIIFIAFLIIIATSIFLGRGKSLMKQKLFIAFSAFLILTGIITTILIKSILIVKLGMAKETYDYIDNTFINLALYRFNSYFRWSYLYVAIILGVLLFTLYTNKTMRSRENLRQFTFMCVTSMGVVLTASIIYSFSTMNELFNLPLYIGITSLAQIFILYIPLVAMRLYIGNPEVENTVFTINLS
ncbi:hypothetical protein QYB59_001683 [Clostridium perfringens]|nr:hypothetical protein [Clostridium perfringens]